MAAPAGFGAFLEFFQANAAEGGYAVPADQAARDAFAGALAGVPQDHQCSFGNSARVQRSADRMALAEFARREAAKAAAVMLSPIHFISALVVMGVVGAPDVAYVSAFILRALIGDGLPATVRDVLWREFFLVFAFSLDSCPIPTHEVLVAMLPAPVPLIPVLPANAEYHWRIQQVVRVELVPALSVRLRNLGEANNNTAALMQLTTMMQQMQVNMNNIANRQRERSPRRDPVPVVAAAGTKKEVCLGWMTGVCAKADCNKLHKATLNKLTYLNGRFSMNLTAVQLQELATPAAEE